MTKQIATISLLVALALSGCAPQQDAAKQGAGATGQTLADQSPTAKKKKCSDQLGSRLAPCGEGATGDYVQGSSGDMYRDASMHSAPKSPM